MDQLCDDEIYEIILNPESEDESEYDDSMFEDEVTLPETNDIVCGRPIYNISPVSSIFEDNEGRPRVNVNISSEGEGEFVGPFQDVHSSPNQEEARPRPMPMDVDEEEVRNVFIGPQNLFEWWAVRSGTFKPSTFVFDSSSSGINNANIELGDQCTEIDCFRALFDSYLVAHISEETNRYCNQYKNSITLKPHSKVNKWYETTVAELYTFFAIIMLMAHNSKNKINDYWSTDPLLESPIFRKIFSQDRFFLLLRMLHFSNNDNQIPGDRLHKITTILHSLKVKFSKVFSPYKNLCIDESILKWKGRLLFKQFMPNKRHRFGVKLFELCDCKTGFIMDLIVYTGKNTAITIDPNLGISGSVVNTLMEPFLNLGHTLYVDNWYSSALLFQFLHDHKTGAVGTVRLDRKNMPKFPKLKTGEYQSQHTPFILVEKWVDRRDVNIISTTHKNELKESGKINRKTQQPILKPASVLDYNKNMGLIDKGDMQMSFTDSARKTTKWYKKLFVHLLDITILNSYILFKVKTGKNKLQLSQFRLNLIRQLLEEFTPQRPSSSGGRRSIEPAPLRLTARHFPDYIPATTQKEKPRRKCFVCKWTTLRPQKRRETPWMCRECDIPLCIPECFKAYHSVKHF